MGDKPKIWVCSLQYSPIYKSHCYALGRQAESHGYEVRYLFSKAYDWMLNQDIREKTLFIGNSIDIKSAIIDGFNYRVHATINELLLKNRPDYIYFYNFHPFLNHYIAKRAKKVGIAFIQHVQEPYVEDKTTYKGLKRFWLFGFEYLQQRLLGKTNIAIVSSERSIYLFKKRYKNYQGKLLNIPLMYEDYKEEKSHPGRQFITFIGPLSPAKGSEIFFKIMQISSEKDRRDQFLLVTRKKVTDPRYHQYNNLTIEYHENISDDMIIEYQKSSRMVLTPYTVATQSSVVLTSQRYGTPALSSNVGGLPEFIEHKKTGYMVDINAPLEEWLNGIDFINNHFDEMSVKCRNYYQNNFAEKNWPKYFDQLFGDI